MATLKAQTRWRRKHRFVKTQLNVMARSLVHHYLQDLATRFDLRGKGEAVTFAAFVTKAMIQQAEYNPEAARLLEVFTEVYQRDRELYSA